MGERKRLLVSGASGFLGGHVCRSACRDWDVFGVSFSKEFSVPGAKGVRADLTRYAEVKSLFEGVNPHAVIHCAAQSDVNWCQTNPELSRKINVASSVHMAQLCAVRSIPCVFTSSDMVFDGERGLYLEDDAVNPLNVYGEHKVLSEKAMRDIYPHVLICRLPLMFGPCTGPARNFLQSMVLSAKNCRELKLFVDEFRTPVYVRDIVHAILNFVGQYQGILHLGGPERISRFEMGRVMNRLLGCADSLIVPALREEVRLAAPRPRDVSLRSEKAESLGFKQTALLNALAQSIS